MEKVSRLYRHERHTMHGSVATRLHRNQTMGDDIIDPDPPAAVIYERACLLISLSSKTRLFLGL